MKGVDGGDEAERIEIELTTHDPRPNPEPKPDEPSGDHPQGPTVSPRGRVAALVVGVGLGALALGWVLGSAGGDQTAAESSVTTEDASDEPDRTARVGETVPPAEITTTTSERPRPTTTTLPQIALSTIEVAPQLASMPFELVGVTQAGRIVVLDLASSTMMEDRGIGVPTGPSFLWADAGWIVVPDRNGSLLVEDGSEPLVVDLGTPWNLVESATPGRFWRMDDLSPAGLVGETELVDRYGESLGETIELPRSRQAVMADPAGGLLVTAPGGAYSVTPEGAFRIVDGEVLAIGVERALAHRCDDRLVCEHVVVDRATGDVSAIALDLAMSQPIWHFWNRGDLGTIGPDGRTAAVGWLNSNGGQHVGLIDLDTAEITPLSMAHDAMVRWSPDGRYVFYLEAGRAMAHDLTTGESFIVAVDFRQLTSLAIRPGATEPTAD